MVYDDSGALGRGAVLPATADMNNPAAWLVVLFTSFACLFILLMIGAKKDKYVIRKRV
jgi:hypothetical protein